MEQLAEGYKKAEFQSTLLMRGATVIVQSHIRKISNFNPRSSCEERR